MNEPCTNWKDEFTNFIKRGEAGDAFLLHLDGCESCGRAVDEEFHRSARAFKNLAKLLAETQYLRQKGTRK